jgi:dTDP-4-dehydrorhamnose 3,5-epimerase
VLALKETGLPGCLELQPRVFEDARGRFVKVFNRELFAAHGLETSFAEEYYSSSLPGVLRGLHFQTPPHHHAKLVYCVAGRVMDVAVDLRVGSPTYGRHAVVELSMERGNAIYLPSGFAHGFYVPQGEATLVYNVTTGYAPESDAGIRWDSAGIEWPDATPVVSERDAGFPSLAEFDSPFRYGG